MWDCYDQNNYGSDDSKGSSIPRLKMVTKKIKIKERKLNWSHPKRDFYKSQNVVIAFSSK